MAMIVYRMQLKVESISKITMKFEVYMNITIISAVAGIALLGRKG
jgi:hypothetical protein